MTDLGNQSKKKKLFCHPKKWRGGEGKGAKAPPSPTPCTVPANTSASKHTDQIFFSSSQLELSPWFFTHVFKKIETSMRWNCTLKALLFLQITAEHQDCPFFTLSLTIKTSFENISKTLKYISLKLHENRGGYWREKLPLTILEEQFPVPTGWGSLLWPLRCHCNPDHNKFSSLSNTTMVAIFPNLCSCYGDVIYAQTWEVLILKNCIEPPKISLFQLRFTDLKKNRFPFLENTL